MSKRVNWNIPVPKVLDDALEQAVTLDSHSSKSEFVRDSVRRRLETMGFNLQVFEQKAGNAPKSEAQDGKGREDS
jgi:Arc/MetJ-type ribon-helix-helix transcriptional regulator